MAKHKPPTGVDEALTGVEILTAETRGYIAATRRLPVDDCPHAGGVMREAWMRGFEMGLKAVQAWA